MDGSSFDQTQKAMKDMDKTVTGFAGGATKQFAVAGAAVTSFFVAANIGIAKFMNGLAEADQQNEMFARRMWMSKDSAVAYKNVMSALGAELQDLYLSPELVGRYRELRKEAERLAAPQEYGNQMQQLRDVSFEFQRMRLEATYAMQWIGYYLFKYLEKPIGDFKKSLSELNDGISLNMPEWTKKIAQVVSWVVRLGSAGAWGVKKLLEALNELSPKTKVAGSAFLGFFALLKMGPIGWLIAGVTALLLLMDDFKTYQEGGESLFGRMWKEVDGLKKTLEDDGTFEGFNRSLDDISNSLLSIIGSLGTISDKIATGLGFKDFTDMLNHGVINGLHMLEDVLSGIAGALEIIDGILSWDIDKMQSGLNKLLESINNTVFGRKIGGHLNKAAELGGSGDGQGMMSEYLTPILGENLAYDFVGRMKDFFGDVGEFFDNNLVSPRLPYAKHAKGGIQTTPHFGWVAEEYPESIIPLAPNQRQNALNLLAQTAGLLGVPMASSTSNTINNYNITHNPNYTIYGSEPNATARAIERKSNYGMLIRNFKGVQ